MVVNVITLDVGKWIPNLGAILKVIIFLAIIIGAYAYVQDHGMANPLTLETLKPDWGNSMQYIPAIIYGMLGFELVSAGSEEMRDPARDVPRSIFISGAIIIVLYLLGTMAVLAAIPAGDINLVEGLIDTLQAVLWRHTCRQPVRAGTGYRRPVHLFLQRRDLGAGLQPRRGGSCAGGRAAPYIRH